MTDTPMRAALHGEDWQPAPQEPSLNGAAPAGLRKIDLGALVGGPHRTPVLHEGLIYPRKLHVIGGEPGEGKSTVLIYWLLAAIARGHPVALFDWEAGAEHTADLLHSFGADKTDVSRLLHYYPHLNLSWNAGDVTDVAAELRGIKPVIVGFDSSISVLSAMGGNENSPTDIRRMWATLAPIAYTLGCSVIATDHSGKDAAESRYNRGSTDKLAAVDCNFKLTALQRFSRHQDGKLQLTVTKDRPGWLHWYWDITVTRDPLTLTWRQGKASAIRELSEGRKSGAAAGRLVAVLTDEPAELKTLVDRIVAGGGYPVDRTTAQRALGELHDNGLADKITQGKGLPVLWAKARANSWDPHPETAPRTDTLT